MRFMLTRSSQLRSKTFLKIMDEKDLPSDVVSKARNFKIRGSSGKLNIALDGLPISLDCPKIVPFVLARSILVIH